MSAIDLLFAVKPDSERLHQIALASLLRHGPLLSLLGEVPAGRTIKGHAWEPLDGTFDLALQLDDGSQIFIELKVDSALNERQRRLQMQELRAEGRKADRLLYLLLGYTAITTDRPRVDSIAAEVGVPKERYAVRGAADLIRALESTRVLDALDADGRDARDLAVAYRAHLQALDQRTKDFFSRPVEAWQRGDFLGYFAHCRATVLSMQGAGIEHVNNPNGGFPGCWWGFKEAEPGVSVYLQFEGPRLMVKVEVEPADRRGAVRGQACTHLLSLGQRPPLQIFRPARLGHGQSMTIGHVEGVPFGQADRQDDFAAAVAVAEEIVAEVARRLR